MTARFSALVGLMIVGSVANASAAPVTYTYTGTVYSGYDQAGVFGAANTDLTGDTFKVVETFDSAKTAYAYSNGSSFSYQYGGSGYGYPGSASSKISINSSPFRTISDTYDYNYSQSGYNYNYVEQAGGNANNNVIYTIFSSQSPSLTYDLTKSVSIVSGSPNTSLYGYYNNYAYSYDNEYSYVNNAYASFDVASVTVSSLSAVPLPASLPLFGGALLCLAGLGYGVKRRPSRQVRAVRA